MADVAYLQRRVRADDIGGACRAEYAIPGMPGISIVKVDYDCGVSEHTVSLDGIRYLTIAEAAAAWRLKRQRGALHDTVGNALHSMFFGDDQCRDWGTMSASERSGFIEGAATFLAHLENLGMSVTKRGD